MSNIYYWKKLTFSKLFVFFGIIILSCLPCLRFPLICFAQKIKGFYQCSLGRDVGFRDINKRFSKLLGLKKKSFLNGTRICRWKSTDNNDFNIFLSLENPCTILLTKEKTWKRIFNTNSELSQNCTEKQIMPSKTTINWLFNDIWCFSTNSCKSPLYPQ